MACKLADVDVITGYPIRPYDTVMQYIAKLIADGEFDCEYIVAEGEHSQFEIVKHASAVGARVFTGSSGVGWMYAFECLTVTPALRIPMVAMVGNRALDDPGAFGVEHNDALAVRDLGWQLVWVDNAQEALDTALIAYRVAEDRRIFLPCAISCDGAFLTHSQALVKIPSQEKVDAFLPRYNRGDLLLHPDNPISVAPQANEDWLMEIRRQTAAAMERSPRRDPRSLPGFREDLRPQLRQSVLRGVHDRRRRRGAGRHGHAVHAGEGGHPQNAQGRQESRTRARSLVPSVCRRRSWPSRSARFKAVGVIDRDFSLGSPYHSGVLATEIRAALYPSAKRPPVLDFICGLGGREVTVPDVEKMTEIVYAGGGRKAAAVDAMDRSSRIAILPARFEPAEEDDKRWHHDEIDPTSKLDPFKGRRRFRSRSSSPPATAPARAASRRW